MQASLEALLEFNFTNNSNDKKRVMHHRSKSFTKKNDKQCFTTLITERSEEPINSKERRLSFENRKCNNSYNKGSNNKVDCIKHKKYYKFDSENASLRQIELFSNVYYLSLFKLINSSKN